MSCLVAEQLQALCDGSIDEEVAESLLEHIEHCGKCEASLHAIEQASAAGLVKHLLVIARSQPFCDESGYQGALWVIRNKTLPQALSERERSTTAKPRAARQPRITQLPFQLTPELTLIRHISRGGVGTVFEARQAPSGRPCAVKILNEDHLHPQSRLRFKREVRLLQALDHPHIVRIWEYGEWEGYPYLVTEYVEAESLGSRIRRDGPLDVPQALELMLQSAGALQYAHELSIVHRDFTPANVLLDQHGVIKIIDLGLAKALTADQVDDEGGLTPRGIGAGTLAYMAPEQAEGLHKADERSDIYSFAATFCFVLNGSTDRTWLLEGGDSEAGTVAKTVMPSISAQLNRALARMLASKPADRHQTMAAVVADLASVQESISRR